MPANFSIEQANDDTLTYRMTDLGGRTTVLPRENVFHLRGDASGGDHMLMVRYRTARRSGQAAYSVTGASKPFRL